MVSETDFEQFKSALGNSYARRQLGFDQNQAEANWILADEVVARIYYDRWVAHQSDEPPPARQLPAPALRGAPAAAPSRQDVPGRVSGFVLSIISVTFMTAPIFCLPLSVTGLVLSTKAMRAIPVGAAGRGLAVAGLTIGIATTSITTLLMLLAIPGAIQHNFG